MPVTEIFILSTAFSHQYQDAINISIAGSDQSRVTFAERFGNGKDPNPKIKISDQCELTILNSEKIEKISRLRYFRRHVNNEYFIYKSRFICIFEFVLGKNTF